MFALVNWFGLKGEKLKINTTTRCEKSARNGS